MPPGRAVMTRLYVDMGGHSSQQAQGRQGKGRHETILPMVVNEGCPGARVSRGVQARVPRCRPGAKMVT